jgi:hypothetical protein
MPTLEDAKITPPGPPHSFLAVVKQLMPAIYILAAPPDQQPPPAIALSMLCAHTLECALKAVISRDGDGSRLRDANIRHNISKLWEEAQKNGLSSSIPESAQMLSKLHGPPHYHLRYLIKCTA